MRINEVSEKTGLSIYTLRYYEDAGLIFPVARLKNGHRDYTERDVQAILFVVNLREAGMPIADIQRYIHLVQMDDETVLERLEILKDHQHLVQTKIKELQAHLGVISAKIDHYYETYQEQLNHQEIRDD